MTEFTLSSLRAASMVSAISARWLTLACVLCAWSVPRAEARAVASLTDRPGGYVWASRPLVSQTTVGSEHECRARCLSMPRCNFGTYLPGYGTCWLAAHPPKGALTKCGVKCSSWQRMESEGPPPTPSPQATAAPLPTPPPSPSAAAAAAAAVAAAAALTTTAAPTPPPTPRPTCSCNPATHPSAYTQCHRDKTNRVHVTHVTSKIYRHDGMDNQHVCKVTGGVCQCCDCLPQISLTSLSTEMRLLPAGSYSIAPPFLAQGQANLKQNLAECQLACAEDEQCRTGTYILRGVDLGECWLSTKAGPRQLCTQPCQSFAKGSS